MKNTITYCIVLLYTLGRTPLELRKEWIDLTRWLIRPHLGA